MTVKKSVAAAQASGQETTIPETASGVGELKTTPQVTTLQSEDVVKTSLAEAVAVQKRIDTLAKARMAKATKAKKVSELAAKQASTVAQVSHIQDALQADAHADRHAFGEIREVARSIPTAEEYVRVEIPLADLFDHGHPGVQLNRHKFEPGKTYLLRGDVALEVKKRLAMFHDEQVRLLRPNADRKALNDVNRGSQWTSRGGNAVVPLGRLEDVAVGSDEKIYTVDF